MTHAEEIAQTREKIEAIEDSARRLGQAEIAIALKDRANSANAGPATWALRLVLLEVARDYAPEGIVIEIPPEVKQLGDLQLKRHASMAETISDSAKLFREAADDAESDDRRNYLQGMADAYALVGDILTLQQEGSG